MSSGYEEQRRRRRVSAPIASAMIDRPAPMLGVSDAAVPPQPVVPPRMPEIQPPRPAPYAMDPYEMNRGTMAGPVPNAPVDVTAGLGISRPRYANTPAIEDVADPTLTSPGATPGYLTPEQLAAQEVPDERSSGWGRVGKVALGLLSGGGNEALAEATGAAARQRTEEKRRIKAAEYRAQREESRQADEDAYNRTIKKQTIDINRQRIDQGNAPDYSALDLGEGQVAVYDKRTGEMRIQGERRPKIAEPKGYTGHGINPATGKDEYFDLGQDRKPVWSGVEAERPAEERPGKADPLAGYKAAPLDQHIADATGLRSAQAAQDQLTAYDQEISKIDEQIAALGAQGDDEDAKASRSALEGRRDDLRSERNDLMGRIADAKKAYRADQLREKEHPAATPKKTSSGVSAPKAKAMTPEEARQALIDDYGSWDAVPDAKKRLYEQISGTR